MLFTLLRSKRAVQLSIEICPAVFESDEPFERSDRPALGRGERWND